MYYVIEKVINVKNIKNTSILSGVFDVNIKIIENSFNVKIFFRDNILKISGNDLDVNLAFNTINVLISLIDSNQEINEQLVKYIVSLAYNDDITDIKEILDKEVYITLKGSSVKPKTITQKHYIDQIKNNSIVIGVGPAGTGKTYLAVAMAVMAFKNKTINKIILTRPAVEAGEKLGFLPGDL